MTTKKAILKLFRSYKYSTDAAEKARVTTAKLGNASGRGDRAVERRKAMLKRAAKLESQIVAALDE